MVLIGYTRINHGQVFPKQSLLHFSFSLKEWGKALEASLMSQPREKGSLKNWDLTILCQKKVHLVKAMVFPVVMCGYESWTVKKAEHRRIDAFELWCWGRLLRVPWTSRRSNQSILKEIISPEYSLEGLMLKLKLQYFGHLTQRTDSLKAGGEGDNRGWDGWMASPIRWTWVWVNSGSWSWTGRPGVLQFMGLQRVGHDWATELNWTELNWTMTYTRSLAEYSH